MNKPVIKSEYELQADQFLRRENMEFTAKFFFHGPHWEYDKDSRDVYQLTLERPGRKPLTIRFGQSKVNSRNYWNAKPGLKTAGPRFRYSANVPPPGYDWGDWIQVKPKAPTAYDLLSCLTKYDPGSLENFCGEFGYDTDSRKAEKTWRACLDEWHQVQDFFTEAQLNEIREIN